MTAPRVRKNDEGTAYAAALRSGAKTGASRATDAELMAQFCEHTLQLIAGAVSPRLTWEGAQSRGMTTQELAAVCHARDWGTLDALQFGDAPPSIRVEKGATS